MINEILSLIDEKEEEIYSFLKSIVEINSFTNNINGIETNALLIAKKAEEHGLFFKKIYGEAKSRRFPHLIFSNTTEENFYAVIGHFDTVHPPEGGFLYLREEKDRLIGPGVNDMKGGIAVSLFSFIIFKELGLLDKIPLKILYNSDEEIGSPSSRPIIKREFHDAEVAFVFEAGRLPGNKILTSRKGAMILELNINGRASHAGEAPEEGVNAIIETSKKLLELERLGSISKNTSVSVGKIHGGTARNVVPAHCWSLIDVRYSRPEEGIILKNRIEEILSKPSLKGAKIDYHLNMHRPPFIKRGEVQKLIDLYKDTAHSFGIEVEETSSGGVSDANTISGIGVPTIDGLGPVGANPHSPKEFIIKRSVVDRIKIFTVFMYRLIKQ